MRAGLTIPALSFRQPWIWAIFECGKRVENRTWRRQFRGEFLIHASQGMTKRELEDGWMFARSAGGLPAQYLRDPPRKADLQFGGIVGMATIERDPLPPMPTTHRDPWHMWEQWGYPLTNVKRLRSADGAPALIPWRGSLGFFAVERAELATELYTRNLSFVQLEAA